MKGGRGGERVRQCPCHWAVPVSGEGGELSEASLQISLTVQVSVH